MKTILLSIFAFAFTLNVFAQASKSKAPKSPEEAAKIHSERLGKELGLNADQTAKIYTLFLNQRTKMEEIKAKYPNDKEKAKAEMKPVKEQFKADMKSTLTPEQYAKWEEMKKKKETEKKNKKQEALNDIKEDDLLD
ncbi:MAG: DUF4890 domain-containing protein [Cytophagaceae bacterium]|nr:DUF4890 domain-containing protein [Cytophagaceae bacterium]